MPDRASVQRAVALFTGPAEYEYFFAKLGSASWILPLIEEGRFASPPQSVREGDYISFPSWPESSYLARFARQAPERAALVLRQVGETDNPRVHLDLIDVALQIAPPDAAAWATRESEWVAQQPVLFFNLPEKLAQLVAFCARHGYLEAALSLARTLFAVTPDVREATHKEGDDSEFSLPPEPRAKCEAWYYAKALSLAIPALTSHADLAALDLFSDILAEAVRLSRHEREAQPPLDYSFIWHDAIESERTRQDDVRDALVTAVRDLGVAAANLRGPEKVVATLEARRWDVFRRIALHVIRVCGSRADQLARDRIVNRAAFSDAAIDHEYVLLLRNRFASLSSTDQQEILGWIEAGPDRERMRARHFELAGEELTPELERLWVERWQRDWLSPLREGLPEGWKERAERLATEHGPPESSSAPLMQFGWHREQTPITTEELTKLGVDGIRRFFRDWIPESGYDKPSRQGAIGSLMALGDDYFASESTNAEAWAELHPAYVSALLRGIVSAVRAGTDIDWGAVLRLCERVSDLRSHDLESRWLRQGIADLIVIGLKSATHAIPRTERERIWAVIARLLDASALEGVAEDRMSPGVDYLTAAINSARGRAFEAAIRYAVWCKTLDAPLANGEWSLLEHLSTVAAVLERLVDPDCEISPDPRSTFGVEFGLLLWLDKAWLKAHLQMLFPAGPELSSHRDAVWESYLFYSNPFPDALDLLEPEYSRSVDELNNRPAAPSRARDVDRKLAEHLMVYYWLGRLPLEGSQTLLVRFFERADLKLRSHAWDFLGRSLRSENAVVAECLERLQALLDWRLLFLEQIAAPSDQRIAAEELESFGWWFSSGKFEEEWSLNRLVRVLRLGTAVEPDHLVAERLAALVVKYPADVVVAIQLMIGAAKEGYGVAGWSDAAEQILKALLATRGGSVRFQAEAAIDTLVASGMHRFRKLIPKD